jgi:hypothetical protein
MQRTGRGADVAHGAAAVAATRRAEAAGTEGLPQR